MADIHDVRHYYSTMTGAPSKTGLNGAGKLIALLDACLVDGFNVNSVTGITVSGGIATATTDANHNFTDYSVIRIWGATESGLNGDWKCSVPAGNTFTFPTAVPDGTYTAGTVAAKTAPLGWTKEFSGTNVAVYRQKGGLRHYFRLDDSGTNNAFMRGYESMTSAADAGTQPFPTTAQLASGVSFGKFNAPYAQHWFLAGDDKTVYLIYSEDDNNGILTGSANDYTIKAFGEINSYTPGDAGHSFVAGSSNGSSGSVTHCGLNAPGVIYDNNYMYGGMYLSRPYSQVPGAPSRARIGGSGLVHGWGSSFDARGLTPMPNPADLADLYHYPVLVQEESSKAVRGEIRGLWQPLTTGSLANVGSTFDINGRKIRIVRATDASRLWNSGTTNRTGTIGVDITGPW